MTSARTVRSRKSETANDRKASGTLSGGFWTVIERITAQAGQLIVFIAAARILGPAEFGVFALVSAVAILLLRVAEFGWAQFIMSWDGGDLRARQTLMVAIFSGLGVGLLGLTAAGIMYALGAGATMVALFSLFSVWLLLATTSSAQKGIMIRQDKLKWSAAAETSGEIIATGVALLGLFSGLGVLSLALGRLAFQATHLTVSFVATRLPPALGLKRAELRDILTFSWNLFLTRMIMNLRTYMATFIIGGFLGPAAVGYYRAAERLVGAMAEVVAVPTEVLAWSLFRRARDQEGGSITGFHARAAEFFKVLFALAVPVFVWIAIMGPELVATILGHEWLPAVPVVAILALSRIIILPGHATEAILSLAGEIRRLVPFSLVYLVLGIALILAGAQFGLMGVAWAQVGIAVVVACVTFFLQVRYGAIRWAEVATGFTGLAGPVLAGAAMLIASKAVALSVFDNHIVAIAASTVASVALYAALLLLTQPDWRRIVGPARRSGNRTDPTVAG